nr:MAG TPA: hypothetical protein [Caudoviricetes sp.]
MLININFLIIIHLLTDAVDFNIVLNYTILKLLK